MANIPGEIVWQANDNTWFTNNAAEVYPAGITIYHVDGRYKFTDGVTTLSALPFRGDSSSSGVQSVTGPNVDNTDPANPVVNPLGLIQIIDLNGEFFTDLATAQAYLRTYINETIYPITDESFNSGVYFFTVPENTECILLDYFLGDLSTSKTASIIDEFGLISKYGDSAFYRNNGNNTFYNVNFNPSVTTVARSAFRYSTGINQFNNLSLTGTNFFGYQSVGKFIIKGNIGSSESANYTASFFGSSTSTILARSEKYTSNAGGIQGDLQTAISNGCNVQFEGINLVTLNTNQTLTNKRITQRVTTITSSSTPTPNADTDDLFKVTALAAAALLTNPTGTPTAGQTLLIRIKDNGTARALTFDTLYRFSSDQPAPTTTVINKTLYLGFVYNFDDTKWDCLGYINNI